MISIESRGSFDSLAKALRKMAEMDVLSILNHYGEQGVVALSNATPVRTGETAGSWYFEASHTSAGYSITWHNRNLNDGLPIAILLQYGHGTGTGGYVQGQDYINPAIRPIFDMIASEVWKAVTSS